MSVTRWKVKEHHLSTTSCAPVVQTSSSQRAPALTLWCQLPNIWRQTKHHLSTSCAPMPLLSIKTWDSKDTKSSLDQLFSIPSCESLSWLLWEEMGGDIPCKRKLWELENLEIQGERRVITTLETLVEKRLTTRWDQISQVTWENGFNVEDYSMIQVARDKAVLGGDHFKNT